VYSTGEIKKAEIEISDVVRTAVKSLWKLCVLIVGELLYLDDYLFMMYIQLLI